MIIFPSDWISIALMILFVFPVNCQPVKRSHVAVTFAIRSIAIFAPPVVNDPAITRPSSLVRTIALTLLFIFGSKIVSTLPVAVIRAIRFLASPLAEVKVPPTIIPPSGSTTIVDMVLLNAGLKAMLIVPTVNSDAPHV